MKHSILRAACLLCAGALALSLTGCGSSSSQEASSAASETSLGLASDYDYANFDYSQNIAANGYWEDVRALDYVTLPEDFAAVPVSKEAVEPTAEEIQQQIDAVLASASTISQITDRAAADGDTVNIDYVGSVDGVEFTGGSYDGFDLDLGSGTFIDGFEEQIVGHMPGESFDVTVTFPDGYRDSTDAGGNTVVLENREAVFRVTLNYISETVTPELTDAWVADYLGESDGLYSVAELEDYFQNYLYRQNLASAISSYLMENASFNGCPDVVRDYQVSECLNYYATTAQYYGLTLDEFIPRYLGYEDADALLSLYEEDILSYCREALLYQAVAESLDLTATDALYEPYSAYADSYGENYLRMYALVENVMENLCDGAKVS